MNWSEEVDRTYWHKQTSDKPLFPDLLWSRPENRAYAGKLFIAGGNLHSFASPAEAYTAAEKAGVGVARVLLPDSLQKTVGRVFEAGEYAPSTPSGSFSQKALLEFMEFSNWSDGVLLAGSFGKNSETAILLESFAEKYTGPLAVVEDAVDYFLKLPDSLLNRQQTTLVLDFSQLQKLAIAAHVKRPFTSSMDFLHIIDGLHEFTQISVANLILVHEKTVFIAVQGEISTTQFDKLPSPTKTAACTSVWWIQNISKTLEALTTAVLEVRNAP